MKAATLLLGIATTVLLIGHGGRPGLFAADASQTNITVEILIFSGRPNPAFQLHDVKPLDGLKAKMKDLPEAFKEEPADWSRLGFGGFVIRGGASLGLPGEIRVYQGVIKTGHGRAARFQKDTQGLEAFLIAEARMQTLPPPAKEAIEKYDKARKTTP